MFSRKLIRGLFLTALLAGVILAPLGSISASNGDGNIVLSSPMMQGTEPITNYGATSRLLATVDPQRGEDDLSIAVIENLFLGLTDVDPKTSQVRPEAATKWEKNATGDVWTFTLRNDIPWVRWNPQTKQATKVRMVTAGDFEYGIKRSCDPRIGALYTFVAATIIKGCDVVAKINPDQVKDSDFDQIGVKALSDTQLQITIQGPIGVFLQTSGMWMFRAVPKETIAEFGDKWIEPGNIVSNGPFLFDQWDKNVNRTFVKNTLYPEVNDSYGGNIERIQTIIVKDGGTLYSLYQNNEVDSGGAPPSEYNKIRADPVRSKEIVQRTILATQYISFFYDKPPFDNVHVRRAFSAAFDRKSYVQEVLSGLGVPISHFMPPGIRGAIAINEVFGIGAPDNPGFDPDFAKKELEAGGFKDCANFPTVTMLTVDATTAEFLQNQIKINLGCDASKLNIEESEFTVLLKSIKPDVPTPQRPHLSAGIGWNADYADAQNWYGDVLSCNAENVWKRPCSDLDKQIDAAAKETDPKKRDQMYHDIEEAFFGKNGEFPILPMYVQVERSLVKPWYKGFFQTDGLFAGPHWNTRSIDQAAQLAARANKGGGGAAPATPSSSSQ